MSYKSNVTSSNPFAAQDWQATSSVPIENIDFPVTKAADQCIFAKDRSHSW